MSQEQLVETLQEMKKIAGKKYHEFKSAQLNQIQCKNKLMARELGEDAMKEYTRLKVIHEILELINE